MGRLANFERGSLSQYNYNWVYSGSPLHAICSYFLLGYIRCININRFYLIRSIVHRLIHSFAIFLPIYRYLASRSVGAPNHASKICFSVASVSFWSLLKQRMIQIDVALLIDSFIWFQNHGAMVEGVELQPFNFAALDSNPSSRDVCFRLFHSDATDYYNHGWLFLQVHLITFLP